MMFLLFQLGEDRFALEARRVIEVLPLVELRRIPGAPHGLAGMLDYHGEPVPVIDLKLLSYGQPAAERFSTRIIILRHSDEQGREHPLGLIAEHATQIIRRDPREFVEPGLKPGGADYLGPVLMDDAGMIHWVREKRLLPAPLRDALFLEPAPATA